MLAGTQAGVFAFNGSTWTALGQGSGPGKLSASVQALLPLGGRLLAGTFGGGVFRSSDGGQTWAPPGPGSGMPAGETVWSLTSFASMVLAGTTSGVYRSLDGGVSWMPSGDGIPPGVTTFRVFGDSGAPNVWYAGTGSGVYRSLDAGFTWSPISNGLPSGGNGAVRDLKSFVTADGTRLYAATGNGVYSAVVRLGALPGEVRWSQVSTRGMAPNLELWALTDLLGGSSLLAGSKSDGGFGLTFTPPFSIAAPSVEGSVRVGATVSADVGSWIGTGTLGFGFGWQRCTTQNSGCTTIRGAEGNEYVVGDDDFGMWLRVVVTATNGAPLFTFPSATSAGVRATAKLGSLPGDSTTSAPLVTIDAPGDRSLPRVGDVARISVKTTMPNQTFNPNPTFAPSYQWLRCAADSSGCKAIVGATGAGYVLQTADAGMRVKARVTGANVFGAHTLESANASNLVIPDAAQALVAPALGGSATVGETLVGNVGGWKSPKTTWERQWQRCEADGSGCNPIIGGSGAAYTVAPLDVGKRLRMRVLADVNESYALPAAVEAYTPLSEVVPVPGGGADGGGAGGGGTGGGGTGGGGAGGGGGGRQGGGKPAPTPDHVAPVVRRLSLSGARFSRRGTGVRVAFRLSERATLKLTVVRAGKRGRTVARATVKRRPAGPGAFRLRARVGGSALAPGRYRLLVSAVDGAGNRGRAVAVGFRVVR
ncbi:MAG TPA: hypothetical protein VLK58_08200 [Conexibacter sp.]|nr:hypothetical protein [Conexibacter sp.]